MLYNLICAILAIIVIAGVIVVVPLLVCVTIFIIEIIDEWRRYKRM